MMGSFYNMGWGFGFGGIFMLILWGLVIWGIIMLAKNISGEKGCCGMGNHSEPKNSEDSAMNILRERYAKGEISKEDFEKMKTDLQ